MSVGTILTFGFGSFGSVNLLPTLGYGAYGSPVVVIDTHDGGRKKRNEEFRQRNKRLRQQIEAAFEKPVVVAKPVIPATSQVLEMEWRTESPLPIVIPQFVFSREWLSHDDDDDEDVLLML